MGSGLSSDRAAGSAPSPVKLLLAGLSWRLFGGERSGSLLLDTMDSSDEQSRMLAGMSLVKAGARSFDLIEKRVRQHEASPAVIRLLPDIDRGRSRAVLTELASNTSDDLKTAAIECIDLLDRIDAGTSG